MSALAVEVSEQAKMDIYVAQAKRLPKSDRRELSRATAQTKWVMEATAEWYAYFHEGSGNTGLPTENVLHRAALLIPRSPVVGGTPHMEEPSARAAAVEAALPHIRESRRRVLIAVERHSSRGVEFAARRLGMSVRETTRYLCEARQSLADVMRGKGWLVPVNA